MKIKKFLVNYQNSDIPLSIGITIIFALTIIFFILGLLFDPLKTQYHLFFQNFQDIVADFFNPIIYVNNLNPYCDITGNTATARIATPLHYVLFYLIHLIIGVPLTLKEMWQDRIAISCVISFLIFSEAFLFYMLSKLTSQNNKFFLILLFFSGENLFAIERGTLVIFTAGCIAGFLHYYHEQEREKQIFALILLSIAAALKVYPALFGLFLLRKRDYKGILFCIVLTSAMGFLPMLLFKGGLGDLQLLFNNLKEYRISYAISPGTKAFISILSGFFSYQTLEKIVSIWQKIVDLLAIIFLFIAFFRGKKEELYFAIASVVILCPIGSMPYTQLYLLPSFIIFMNRIRENHLTYKLSKIDFLLSIGYVLIFMPFQITENLNKTFVLTILPFMVGIMIIKELMVLKFSFKECFSILRITKH